MNAERGVRNAEAPRTNPITLVCFALKEEAAPFRRIAAGRTDIQVLITGIGRRNAERAARDTIAATSPRRVLTCGFAGGLNPELKVGAVVFSADDAPTLAASLQAAGARPARFHCASRIAVTAAEKLELRNSTGADAVEMESGAIHEVCREYQIPCAIVRVISDAASEELPLDFNQLAKPDLSLDYVKLALAIGKSPGSIRALVRMQKQTRLAAQQLATVLAQITAG